MTVDGQIVGTAAGRPRFGPPKTRASNRTVPVPQDVVDMIAEQLARWPSPDVVFLTAHGRPWTRRTLTVTHHGRP